MVALPATRSPRPRPQRSGSSPQAVDRSRRALVAPLPIRVGPECRIPVQVPLTGVAAQHSSTQSGPSRARMANESVAAVQINAGTLDRAEVPAASRILAQSCFEPCGRRLSLGHKSPSAGAGPARRRLARIAPPRARGGILSSHDFRSEQDGRTPPLMRPTFQTPAPSPKRSRGAPAATTARGAEPGHAGGRGLKPKTTDAGRVGAHRSSRSHRYRVVLGTYGIAVPRRADRVASQAPCQPASHLDSTLVPATSPIVCPGHEVPHLDLRLGVPGAGVEPARFLRLRFLRPLRLPLRHPGERRLRVDTRQVTACGPAADAFGGAGASWS